jgi:hypothetical protein
MESSAGSCAAPSSVEQADEGLGCCMLMMIPKLVSKSLRAQLIQSRPPNHILD